MKVRMNPKIVTLLICGGLLLPACGAVGMPIAPDRSPVPSGASAQPVETATPIPTPETVGESEMAEALIVNEDVRRSAMFNLDTLAFKLPDSGAVEVTNYTYAYNGGSPLTLDVYLPPGTPEAAALPAVIFGIGYPLSELPLRNAHFYTSWGKLVAAAGMAAVIYDTERPPEDLEILLRFIREYSDALGIDPDRIGFMSASANGPTVMSYLMQERRSGVRFSIYYYSLSLTPDERYTEGFAEGCAIRGCRVRGLEEIRYVDPELTLLVVRAGLDDIPNINQGMDHFLGYVRGEGAPVTVIEYSEGRHGFDSEQHTEESAEIIRQTLVFMREQFGLPGDLP